MEINVGDTVRLKNEVVGEDWFGERTGVVFSISTDQKCFVTIKGVRNGKWAWEDELEKVDG